MALPFAAAAVQVTRSCGLVEPDGFAAVTEPGAPGSMNGIAVAAGDDSRP